MKYKTLFLALIVCGCTATPSQPGTNPDSLASKPVPILDPVRGTSADSMDKDSLLQNGEAVPDMGVVNPKGNPAPFKPVFATGPNVLVYKTKQDYHNLVPVILSNDKTKIVSYPGPKDLTVGGKLSLPERLNEGYWLDRRGIGINVAFLKLTYAEYAKLETAPSLKEMEGMIVEKDPVVELCNCGNKSAFNSEVGQLNQLIEGKKLRVTCKVVK